MRKNLLAGIGFAALLATVADASASATQQRWPLWYVGLGGGVQFLKDSDISGSASGKARFDNGLDVYASLGYMIPSGSALGNVRLEVEGAYRASDVDSVTLGAATAAGLGSTRLWSYMANGFYDFRNHSQWTPYLGAGLGGARVYLSRNSGAGNLSDRDNVFAWQAMAGLSYAPSMLPNTEWSLGYRYFDTISDPEFATAAGRIKLKDYNSHNVEIGAKFRF